MSDSEYRVGRHKADMTFAHRALAMLGWADTKNYIKGVESRLYCRAVVIASGNHKLAIVSVEIAFVSEALFAAIIRVFQQKYPDLGFSEQNIQISANHTHSAPSGFCHYPIYNLPTPGYCHELFCFWRDLIVQAIVEADQNQQPAKLKYTCQAFAPDIPVAFNRSMQAYCSNVDAVEVEYGQRHLAIDRRMYLLRIENPEGKALACINWFGVHGTSVKNDNHLVSSDNKGFAATYHEQLSLAEGADKDFISLFLQTTAGDVSPNFKQHFGKSGHLGPYRDYFKNKDFNGKLQAEHAHKLFKELKHQECLSGPIRSLLKYYDLTSVKVNPKYAQGKTGQTTGYAAIGVDMTRGAHNEGGGLPKIVIWTLKLLCRIFKLRDEEIHGNKDLFIDSKHGTFLGMKRLYRLPIPDWPDLYVSSVKKFTRLGESRNFPLYHKENPLQIFQIGPIITVNLPSEPTTTQGRRIKGQILEMLSLHEGNQLIVAGYSNGFHGYVTTYEEYQVQAYEGGHTVYGKWTGAAYQTLIDDLMGDFIQEKANQTNYLPKEIPLELLKSFSFESFEKERPRPNL